MTGWAIGDSQESADDPSQEVTSLYDKLEHVILPLFYKQPTDFEGYALSHCAQQLIL